jgi:hypothetical protein
MTDIKLIRHGQKTDLSLYNLYVEHGMDPAPARYDVTEEITWTSVDDPDAVDLSEYGWGGRWTFGHGAIENLSDVSSNMYAVDYYGLPFSNGASAYDEPHTRAEGEV